MKTIYKILLLGMVVVIFTGINCSKDPEEIGEYAPEDAYLEGSEHPYYGSENAWNRRFFYDHIKEYYKRRGQRQMLDIVEGRYEEAANYCRELLAENPNDLESMFNLAVAQTQIGNLDEAMETVKQAVEAGLPFERFLAGPRKSLEPLTATDQFKKYAEKHGSQLIHGPMLGCLTDQGVKVWVRTRSELPVQVVVSTSKNLAQRILSGVVTPDAKKDFTAIVPVDGLTPETIYYYDVFIDGRPMLKPDYPKFTTSPSPGDKARFQVAFGGGAGFVPEHEHIWNVIASYDLSAFLSMGDNVYINMPEMPNGVHYYTYYRRQSRPEYRKLVATTPVYAIWDDHDAATDDCWLGPYREKPSWKLPLLAVFKQNWNNPGYGTEEWPGVWFNFSINDVDFFMLDGRFYRTNPYSENPTMLGPAQKAWLFEQVKNSTAAFKVIASPVPWAFATKGEARDTWNGFKQERQEIFDFLADNKIDGVILLSADRHRSDAWRIERENGYPLYEFESSRLTNQHVHELMPDALFGYNEKNSFGLLTFDTKEDNPTITYEIVNIDNEIIHSITVKKSEISHAE